MRVTLSFVLGLALASFVSMTTAQSLRDPTRPPGGAAAKTASAKKGSRARSEMILQTVLISNERKTAVISGQVVSVGDRISGYKLVEINESEVILKGTKGKRKLRLFPGVSKTKSRVAEIAEEQRGLE
jgi:MSHA biogenesis protein MshK